MKLRFAAITALAGLLSTACYADTTLKLVEVITSPERTEVLKGMVAEFEAANPGVTVEITSLPWGQAFEKLATMVSGGDIPDVVEMPDTWVALYGGSAFDPEAALAGRTSVLTGGLLEVILAAAVVGSAAAAGRQ